jgi:hypothetical protein
VVSPAVIAAAGVTFAAGGERKMRATQVRDAHTSRGPGGAAQSARLSRAVGHSRWELTMPIIEREMVIRRPVDEVFDFVADGRNEPRYNPHVLRAEQASPGAIGRGTRFRFEAHAMGGPMAVVYSTSSVVVGTQTTGSRVARSSG